MQQARMILNSRTLERDRSLLDLESRIATAMENLDSRRLCLRCRPFVPNFGDPESRRFTFLPRARHANSGEDFIPTDLTPWIARPKRARRGFLGRQHRPGTMPVTASGCPRFRLDPAGPTTKVSAKRPVTANSPRDRRRHGRAHVGAA